MPEEFQQFLLQKAIIVGKEKRICENATQYDCKSFLSIKNQHAEQFHIFKYCISNVKINTRVVWFRNNLRRSGCSFC